MKEKTEERHNYLLYRGLVSRLLIGMIYGEAVAEAKNEYEKHGETNDIELYKKTETGTEPVLKWLAGSRTATKSGPEVGLLQ